MKATCGFSEDVDRQLMEQPIFSHVQIMRNMLMDEMHIKEDLVYDKHSGMQLC